MLPQRKAIEQDAIDEYSPCLFGSLRECGGYDPGALEWFLMDGGMPWASTDQNNRRRMYDVVEKDLPKIGEHDPHTLRVVPRILTLIALSHDISVNSIANDLYSVGLTSVRRVLTILVKSQLIFEAQSLVSVRSSGRNQTRKHLSGKGQADLWIIVSNSGGFERRRNVVRIPMKEFLCI